MRQAHHRTYSEETKRRAVELIRLGAGKKLIASLLAIPVYTAKDWIRLYNSEEGEAPLCRPSGYGPTDPDGRRP